MTSNPAPFSQSIGRSAMVFFSIIVLVSFARNFLPFQITYALAASITVIIAYLLIKRPSIPRPSRSDTMPFVASLSIFIILAAYFSKVPYFPDSLSVDMKSHAAIIGSIASGGGMGDVQGQFLYYAIRYILTAFASILPIPALFTVRYGMGIIVTLSPFVFYDSMLCLFKNHRTAWMISLFFALSGLWMSMLFYSGLLPNFYAWLAALFLISATCQFLEKRIGISSLVLWSLAFLNALFSHYSIVFYMVPLAVFALLQSRKSNFSYPRIRGIGFRFWSLMARLLPRRLKSISLPSFLKTLSINGIFIFGLIIGTVSVGIFATGAVSSFIGFLGSSAFPFADSTLSAFIPVSVFRFFPALLNNDFLAILMLVLFGICAHSALKSWSLPSLLIFSILGLTVAIAPFDFAAWRFAFIAFLPLIIVCGQVLSLPMLKMKKVDFNVPKVGLVAFLMFFPVFVPSWGWVSLVSDSSAAQQNADYRAMKWVENNILSTTNTPNSTPVGDQNVIIDSFILKNNRLLSVNDRSFVYQTVLFPKSPYVYYAPDYHVILEVPNQASYLAANLSANYLIVSRNGTAPVFPTPKPFDLSLRASATAIKPNQAVNFTITISVKANVIVALIIGDLSQPVPLKNGTGWVAIEFGTKGDYSAYAQGAGIVTYPISISVTDHPVGSLPKTLGMPSDFYSPWWSFTSFSLGGAELVYQNEMVHIFKITH